MKKKKSYKIKTWKKLKVSWLSADKNKPQHWKGLLGLFSFLFWNKVPWVQDFHSSNMSMKNLEAMKIVSQRLREVQMCKAIHMLALRAGLPDFEAISYDEDPEVYPLKPSRVQ